MQRRLAIVGVLVALASSNCTNSAKGNAFDAFTGFTFVRSTPYESGPAEKGGAGERLPKHGTAPAALPVQAQASIRYIFHHGLPVDDEKLALVDLPERLKSAGIRIVKAPKSRKDLIYPFVGGPLFIIQIQDGRRKGIIYNQLDPDLLDVSASEWAQEDYILVWQK